MLDALITSKTRARLLEVFIKDPASRHYLRGLERELGESATPLRRELLRLERLGLLIATDEANIRYYAVNRQSPLYAQLTALSGVGASPSSGATVKTAPDAAVVAGAVDIDSVAPTPLRVAVVPVAEKSVPLPRVRRWSRRLVLAAVAIAVGLSANIIGMVYVERRIARLAMSQESTQLLREALVPLAVSSTPSQQQASYVETSSARFRMVPGTW